MKALTPICSALLLAGFLLGGCKSNDEPVAAGTPISKSRQQVYLDNARPPQQFGLKVFRAPDGGIAYAGENRLHPQHLANTKMLKGNIPVIKMRGRSPRNKMNALLDFSSPVSWMEFKTSQKFGAHFLGINDMVIPYRGRYNTGGQDAYAAAITQLRIEQLFIEDVPFYVRMALDSLGPLARGIKAPHVDAVIGYDNLRTFAYIQIDMKNNRIRFSSEIPYIPHEELLISTSKIVRNPSFGLAVQGAIDGDSTPIVLDFAGDFSFARGDAKVNSTKQVSLGDLVCRQVPTLVLPVHNSPPRAGRKMLEPYLVTICSKEGVVYFERPLP